MKASNPPKDKRTKAYKEWKAKYDNQSKGLGDTVKKVFDKTGVSKAAKFIAGEDCGCKERQNKMNKIFTYQRPECLNEEEYNLIHQAVETRKNVFTGEEQKPFIAIYERIFRTKVECHSCAFASTIWSRLYQIYQQYQ